VASCLGQLLLERSALHGIPCITSNSPEAEQIVFTTEVVPRQFYFSEPEADSLELESFQACAVRDALFECKVAERIGV